MPCHESSGCVSPCGTASTSTATARATWLVEGDASGTLLCSDVGLSFWGGTHPETGEVTDRHHPLSGQLLAGRVLAIPNGRGSCSGSMALLELLVQGCGPAAVVLQEADEILALGSLVAQTIFGVQIPLVVLAPNQFAKLRTDGVVSISRATGSLDVVGPGRSLLHLGISAPPETDVELSAYDDDVLSGKFGAGPREAMKITCAMARKYGAGSLVDVTRAHIDSCIYTGPASLRFAQHFARLGAHFAIPTTLNAISVDEKRWRGLGLDPELGRPAWALAETYLSMGASASSLTCAPYLLPDPPSVGEQVVWAESNAVVFANSVLGARTQKYPDLLDVCIALTGRAPLAGCHLDSHRAPQMALQVSDELREVRDPSFWPLLGYHVGALAGSHIPIVRGLESAAPKASDLKAFGAAFATTSASPMFHIRGVTPEALAACVDLDSPAWRAKTSTVNRRDLTNVWRKLNSARDSSVGLVSLGNPHFALDEFQQLAGLLEARRTARHPDVDVVVTCGRSVRQEAEDAGWLDPLRAFGATILTDTCWCMLGAPVIRPEITNLMTSSAKYAHYGPGLSGKGVHFGSLAECVDAACTGRHETSILPDYL